MKPGPQPECFCAYCRRKRAARARYYQRNRDRIIRTNAAYKQARKHQDVSLEVSDEELDRRALMGRSA